MFFPKKIDKRRINHTKNKCDLVEPIRDFEGFVRTEAEGNSQKNDGILENYHQINEVWTLMQEAQHYPMFYYTTVWVQNFDFYQINC